MPYSPPTSPSNVQPKALPEQSPGTAAPETPPDQPQGKIKLSSANSAVGGNQIDFKVMLLDHRGVPTWATSDTVVTLKSDSVNVEVPAVVTIGKGMGNASFVAKTRAVTGIARSEVSASASGYASDTLRVTLTSNSALGGGLSGVRTASATSTALSGTYSPFEDDQPFSPNAAYVSGRREDTTYWPLVIALVLALLILIPLFYSNHLELAEKEEKARQWDRTYKREQAETARREAEYEATQKEFSEAMGNWKRQMDEDAKRSKDAQAMQEAFERALQNQR